MYFDEALLALRLDDKMGMPIRRHITRPVDGWQGKWLERIDGQVTVRVDRNLTLPPMDEPLVSTEDMSAADWEVLE